MKTDKTPPQGQAGDGAQQDQAAPAAPAVTAPGPGVADMGDPASAQASQPATPAPNAPSSAAVTAAKSPNAAQAAAVKRDPRIGRRDDGKPVALVAIRVRNCSEKEGFVSGQRVRPGKTFTLQPGDVVGRWMEPVDPKVGDDLAAALEGSPKKRGSAGVVLKNPSRARSGGGQLKPLETGANQDEGI